MSMKRISKQELELIQTAVNKIIKSEVLEREDRSNIPKLEDLPDSNKIYCCKVSMLFVDIRDSTKLTTLYDNAQLAKIYRSYVRVIVQSVRYSGGVVKDFMGDGILAVFMDDNEQSEVKSVNAARYIVTCIDKILNPILYSNLGYKISCGIGIHTGEIAVSKVGMKGKVADSKEEEYGLVWMGESTNLACKFSESVGDGAILVDKTTYSYIEDKDKWEYINFEKYGNLIETYISRKNYLPMEIECSELKIRDDAENDVGNVVFLNKINSEESSFIDKVISIIDKKIDQIEKNSKELERRENQLQLKEIEIQSKNTKLDNEEKKLQMIKEGLYLDRYTFYCDILESGHCKEEYVLRMGVDFWESHLNNAITAGENIGKSSESVKQDVSYAMVSIYEDLKQYNKAYDFLIEQALGGPWLNLSTVQNIVNKLGYCDGLKSAIGTRLTKNDLSEDNYNEFREIEKWLLFIF